MKKRKENSSQFDDGNSLDENGRGLQGEFSINIVSLRISFDGFRNYK